MFLFTRFFPSESIAEERGYRYQGNPEIRLFDGVDLTFRLAIDTSQYGRVFQDRF